MTSQSSAATIARVPSTEMTMASQRGTRWRSIQVNTGHSSAVTRMAIRSGMTRSLSWMMSQIATPIAAATTRNRHEYAVATFNPRGIMPDTSVDTTRPRSRTASNKEPRGLSSWLLITPV